jgi:putative flippase GtrA
MNLNKKQELSRFLRFAFVGLIGAVVDFGIFNLLTIFTPIPAIWASVISFSLAVTSNFIWNRYWTYPDSRSKPIAGQMTQFLVVSLVGLAIRTSLFSFLEHLFIPLFSNLIPTGSISPVTVAYNFTLSLLIGIVMIWNFFANRFWTYNDVK